MKQILILIMLPLSADAFFEYDRAIMQMQKENWPEATNYLNRVLIDHPDRADVLYDSGVNAYKNKEYDKALAYFTKAANGTQAAPALLREQAYFNAANTHVQLKQLPHALEAYDQVLALNPHNEKAKHNKEIVKKMLEQQKQEHEKQQEQQKKDENNQDQEKEQEQNKSDQTEEQQKDNQKEERSNKSAENNQGNDNKSSEQSNQENQNSKTQEHNQKPDQKKSGQHEQQQQKQNSENQSMQAPSDQKSNQSAQQKNEKSGSSQELKLSPALNHALQEREKKDAELNKKMIKAMAGAGAGGNHGTSGW